jgi:hypothetical protein
MIPLSTGRTVRFFWPVLLLWTACRDENVVSYRVPKEKDPAPHAVAAAGTPSNAPSPAAAPAPSGASMADQPVATASGAALTWIAPSNWKAKAPSSMRKGSYTIEGEGGQSAELAITAFPGDVGGELANVNRWRGQLGQTSLSDADAKAAITRIEANGLKIGVVDIVGTANGGPARLVGAMVPFNNSTWFFKLIGADAVVAKEKAAFLTFLQSVRVAEATP